MKKICPVCGAGYEHIVKKHRLGCSFCYFAFRTEMYYVFQEKQESSYTHLGKRPKNYTDPMKTFVNNLIENKIKDEKTKHELKEKIKLNHHGE